MFQIDFSLMKMDTIFVEFRYNDIFSLPEYKFKLLDKLTQKYPVYNIDNADRVILFQPDKEIEIQIGINRMLIQ